MTEFHNTTGQLINEEELDPDHNSGRRNTERTEELDGAKKFESRRPVGLLTEQQLKKFVIPNELRS